MSKEIILPLEATGRNTVLLTTGPWLAERCETSDLQNCSNELKWRSCLKIPEADNTLKQHSKTNLAYFMNTSKT